MKKLSFFYFLSFCCLFLLASCSLDMGGRETTVTFSQNFTETVAETNKPIWGITTPETETVTPSATMKIIDSVPTLTIEQSDVLTFQKIANNGDCRLPCVWGFYPGENRYQVQEFVNQFPNTIEGAYDINKYFSETSGTLRFSFDNDHGLISYSFEYSSESNKIKWMYFDAVFLAKISEGYYEEFGHPSLDQLIDYYTLSQILIEYGQPKEIYFRAWGVDEMSHETRETFVISLYYPEQGFLIQYNGYSSENTGSSLVICPRIMSVDVTSWDPDLSPTLEEVTEHGISIQLDASYIQYYKTIEEASSITIEEFYETYKNPDFTECFQTPAKYWEP